MKIIVAMDSFKGCLSSHELNMTIKKSLLTINKRLTVTTMPIADGGEGTIDALSNLPHAKRISLIVHNPLMSLIKAHYLLLKDTAIIEMAQASGLTLLNHGDKNPLYTTTFGVGELIKDAIEKGAKKLIVTVGGSATHDGGIGLLAALGYRFYDENHNKLDPIGNHLSSINTIDEQHKLHIPESVTFHVACDVTNPLTGPKGAAYTYAKQKGAGNDTIKYLDEGLSHYASVLKKLYPTLNITQPGLGAAGGLPLSLVAFLHADIASGADLIFDILTIDKAITSTDLLITGEGKIDHQTFHNKAVHNLLKRAHNLRKPSIVLAGIVESPAYQLSKYGAVEIRSIHDNNHGISEAELSPAHTKKRLTITLKSLAHYLK